jgi:membrane fusion protein (multidrug efflux system)
MKDQKKPVLIALGTVLLLVLVLGGIKGAQIVSMIEAGESFVAPAQAVTAAEVQAVQWRSELTAVGTLVAVQGVTVSTEVPGTVRELAFESGQTVKKGDLLLRLDTSVERAQLASAVASAQLARAELQRRKNLPPAGAVSQAEVDATAAESTRAAADVANVKAIIAKKTIRAPFSGRLGIRRVNLGEVLQPGAPIVSLQSANPIYAEFSLPQQALSQVTTGDPVSVRTDAYPSKTWEGSVDVVDGEVDVSTRNFKVRASIENPGGELRPGMFVDVVVRRPETRELLVVPSSSVLFAPYGDSVYVLQEPTPDTDPQQYTVEQRFVRLGERRGDLVAVSSGLGPDDLVVSTGAFKLQNGMAVTLRDDLAPEARTNPSPPNE